MGKVARRLAAAHKGNRRHSRRGRRGDAGHGILDHDALRRRHLHLLSGHQEQIGGRLASLDATRRKQAATEVAYQVRHFEAELDAF